MLAGSPNTKVFSHVAFGAVVAYGALLAVFRTRELLSSPSVEFDWFFVLGHWVMLALAVIWCIIDRNKRDLW